MQCTRHIQLYGHVQGVFFRESLSLMARKLGVNGWVRNCADGSLEAMLQGDEATVSALIEWARRGPDLARVDKIDIADGYGEYTDFQRLPTR